MNWFGPQGDCGCCDDCPVLFFFSDCRLYWNIQPIPAAPYTVTITTPSGTEVYDSISSGMIELPVDGTYSGYVTKDSVDSATCSIEVEACTPVNPCCVRTSGINVRLTGGGDFIQWRGGKIQFSTFFGAYAECTLPTWDYESLRVGAMSSGTKTDSNCYDLWGVADFPDFEIVSVGSGIITFYTGMPGYANAGEIPCSVPITDYYIQQLSVDWHLRFYNNGVILRGTITAETNSFSGGPGGTSPPTYTLPTTFTLVDFEWGLCAAGATTGTPDITNMSSDTSLFFVCNGADETVVFECWSDVIPL